MVILLLLCAGQGALYAENQPLTDAQQSILNSTTDFTPAIDTPALHLLFTLPGQSAQININDAITNPASSRGLPIQISGKLARIREMSLARAVHSGKPVREWSIISNSGQAIVVYIAADNYNTAEISVGNNIFAVGYFYKIWRDQDQSGKQKDYPIIVASEAGRREVIPTPLVDEKSNINTGLIILASVVVLWIIFRRLRAISTTRHTTRKTRDAINHTDAQQQHATKTPADALAAMDQRSQEISDSDKDTK